MLDRRSRSHKKERAYTIWQALSGRKRIGRPRARIAKHHEPLQTQMIRKCGDIFRPIPDTATRQGIRIPDTGSLGDDETYALFIQDAVIRVPQVARARDGMHEDDWQTIGVPGVRPGKATSVW